MAKGGKKRKRQKTPPKAGAGAQPRPRPERATTKTEKPKAKPPLPRPKKGQWAKKAWRVLKWAWALIGSASGLAIALIAWFGADKAWVAYNEVFYFRPSLLMQDLGGADPVKAIFVVSDESQIFDIHNFRAHCRLRHTKLATGHGGMIEVGDSVTWGNAWDRNPRFRSVLGDGNHRIETYKPNLPGAQTDFITFGSPKQYDCGMDIYGTVDAIVDVFTQYKIRLGPIFRTKDRVYTWTLRRSGDANASWVLGEPLDGPDGPRWGRMALPWETVRPGDAPKLTPLRWEIVTPTDEERASGERLWATVEARRTPN